MNTKPVFEQYQSGKEILLGELVLITVVIYLSEDPWLNYQINLDKMIDVMCNGIARSDDPTENYYPTL